MNVCLFLLAALVETSSAVKLSDYMFLFGVPPAEYLIASPKAKDYTECLDVVFTKKFSKGKTANAATYAHFYQACYAYSVDVPLFKLETMLKKSDGWITFVRKQDMSVVMWKLDKTSRGKNFGSALGAMDIETEPCSFTGNVVGPNRESIGQYCDVTTKAYEKIPLFIKSESNISTSKILQIQNVVPLFDFTKPFSIGMWVRIRDKQLKSQTYLLGTLPGFGPRFLFLPDGGDRLSFAFGTSSHTQAISTRNARSIKRWRHVAVVYTPPLDIKFYRFGRKWPLAIKIKEEGFQTNRVTPRYLTLFGNPEEDVWFSGQLACVAMFQRSLSLPEVRHLRGACP